MSITEIITIIVTVGGLVSALSLLYGKFIAPVKKVVKQVGDNTKAIKALEESKLMKQVENNTLAIKALDEKITKIKAERVADDVFNIEVRAILFESLLAILEGLEKQGCNGRVSSTKASLIKFMSRKLGTKKKK